jgi:peptide/nickel transport system ATP-binding protein
MIIVDDVVAGYPTRRGFVTALDHVSFTVQDDEILGIAGESGCGKTTLVKLLYGRFDDGLELRSGSVTWRSPDGRETIDVRDFHRHWWRLFSYVPQGSMSALNPLMRIEPQMLDAGQATRRPADDIGRRDRIHGLLAELGLPARTLSAYPHQLSGGMRQRVMIGLASHVDAPVVLADEPTTALDVVVQRQILEGLVRVQRARHNAVVIVSHDLGLHFQVTDRIIVLYAGRLVEIGPTAAVLHSPDHPYTAGLVDALPRLGDRAMRQGIDGRPPDLLTLPPGCRFGPRCPHHIPACDAADPDPRTTADGRQAACIRVSPAVPDTVPSSANARATE